LLRRVTLYAERRRLVVGNRLGSGVHGSVFAAIYQTEAAQSAVKVHEREPAYCRERDVYIRLKEHGVTEIRGCNVPELIAFDDELWVIEMTIVARPFVLDFAGARLDWPVDFSEETLADWRRDKQEQFGPRWAEVQAILGQLEGFGI